MVVFKQFQPGSKNKNKGGSGIRLPSRACHRCRSLHKKCDIRSNSETCSHCERAGVSCQGGGTRDIQIRFSEHVSGQNQRAAASQPEQETIKVPILSPLDDGGVEQLPTPSADNEGQNTFHPNFAPHLESLPISVSASSSRSPQLDSGSGASPFGGLQQNDQMLDADALTAVTPSSQEAVHAFNKSASPVLECAVNHLRDHRHPNGLLSPFPLPNRESKLLKHFWAALLPWFDYCDPHEHFKKYIQYRMSIESCTLFAIFALASRHLEATSQEYHNSNEYESSCLGMMLPKFHHGQPKKGEEGLLVTALFLRCLEEMTRSDDQRARAHTMSANLLVQLISRNGLTDMTKAVMTVALRQEIYIANRLKRPIELEGHYLGIDDSLSEAPDSVWTSRIMSHAARVTNYAYGSEARSQERWDRLWAYVEDWDRKKPSSLNPLNDLGDGTRPSTRLPFPEQSGESLDASPIFPQIYFLSDCPVAARQYLELCRILLLAHDPHIPSLGLGRTQSIQSQESKIRQAVRVVCGVTLSNPEYSAARILAGLVIGMAGELFEDPRETGQLLNIVSEAEVHLGWPGLKVSPQLEEFWGCNKTA